MKSKDYNLNWGEYFQLDEKSPSGLVRIKDYRDKSIEKYNVGTKLFRENCSPMGWSLKFKSGRYAVHRVIWVLLFGKIDQTLVIDHLDGDPFNNNIKNLSLKTPAGNSRNRRKNRGNRSEVTGVKLNNKGNGNFYYEAYWNTVDGVQKRKCFSVSKLGEDAARALAVEYREEQMQKLIDNGADYTERHGK